MQFSDRASKTSKTPRSLLLMSMRWVRAELFPYASLMLYINYTEPSTVAYVCYVKSLTGFVNFSVSSLKVNYLSANRRADDSRGSICDTTNNNHLKKKRRICKTIAKLRHSTAECTLSISIFWWIMFRMNYERGDERGAKSRVNICGVWCVSGRLVAIWVAQQNVYDLWSRKVRCVPRRYQAQAQLRSREVLWLGVHKLATSANEQTVNDAVNINKYIAKRSAICVWSGVCVQCATKSQQGCRGAQEVVLGATVLITFS